MPTCSRERRVVALKDGTGVGVKLLDAACGAHFGIERDQFFFDDLVVVVPPCIPCDPAFWCRIGGGNRGGLPVVQRQNHHRPCSGKDELGVRSSLLVALKPLHLPVETFFKPFTEKTGMRRGGAIRKPAEGEPE
ncbi:MAG: hypothetical protein RLZZ253_831 [Verrucomicrobiota bacterium]